MKVMTMSSNQTTNGKLTNKDLTQIYGRYIHLNGMNDYPGQMHAGFTYSIIPALKKIYADNKELSLIHIEMCIRDRGITLLAPGATDKRTFTITAF